MNKQRIGDALFAITIVGSLCFLAFFLYVARRLYLAFRLTGIPIRSDGEIVANVDAFWGIAVVSVIAVTITAIVIWRAVKAYRSSIIRTNDEIE
jgi:hypothetical protein